MERLTKYLIRANAIVFSFVLPFTIVYSRQETMLVLSDTQAQVAAIEEAVAPQETIAQTEEKLEATTTAPLLPVPKKIPEGKLVAYPNRPLPAQAELILQKVAHCESGNDPLARSPISSAKGLLQIIDGTWKGFRCEGNVLDREDNFRCGMKIATQSGLHHWNPSKTCWAKLITEEDLAQQ